MRSQYTVLVASGKNNLFRKTLFEDRLKEAGYKVISVDCADDLKKRSSKANVLVVDGRLGGGADGVEAVAALFTEKKISPDVPIIFNSIVGQEDHNFSLALTALREGQRRFIWLNYPFELELLLQTISEELERHSR